MKVLKLHKVIFLFLAITIATVLVGYAVVNNGQPEVIPLTKSWDIGGTECFDADSTHDYDALNYTVTIYPYEFEDEMHGIVRVTFTPEVGDFDTLFLHAEDLDISGVADESGALTYQTTSEGLEVNLREAYQPGDTVWVEIDYTAPHQANFRSLGFHRDGNDYCFTFAEPWGARRWFPCYDQPFDKAMVECQVQVPAGYKVASNGELVEVIPINEDELHIWREEDPIATYLISIACGPYAEMTATAVDSIPIHYYVFPEDSADAVYDFENTPDMLEFFSEVFGPYPFQMYGMAEAYINDGWGAMEHQTVTTYGAHLITGDRYYEYVVSHELSHMWWGDCLTPLTFVDIWLNEGFAVYSECLYIEARYDTLAEYLQNLAQGYFNEYLNGYNYAIYDPQPFLFGTTVYYKGAWVQHMLRMVMGDDAFFDGLRNYASAYAYGNVVTAEYQAEMEVFYGGDLSWFFDEWVYQPGFPQYDYSWTVEPAGGEYLVSFDLYQVQTEAPIYRMPVEISFADGLNDTLITVWNEEQSQEYSFYLTFSPDIMTLDPENKILKWDIPLSVEGRDYITPAVFSLGLNYPNPFNSSTVIPFTIGRESPVEVVVYDILGREVQVLGAGDRGLGKHQVVWDAGGLSSGVYLVALESDGISQGVRRVVLLK